MGLGRLVTRRKGTSLVPVIVLGAAVSLGVVAVSASRFGWRRMKAEKAPEDDGPGAPADAGETAETPHAPESPQEHDTLETNHVPRFKPAPPHDPGALRWDSPPAGLATAAEARARPDPPAP
jgi:hypothetical protein